MAEPAEQEKKTETAPVAKEEEKVNASAANSTVID